MREVPNLSSYQVIVLVFDTSILPVFSDPTLRLIDSKFFRVAVVFLKKE